MNSPPGGAAPSPLKNRVAGRPVDIAAGGARSFQLPQDASCASRARSTLAATMREFAFPDGLTEDAKLAVSELATNVHVHAADSCLGVVALPELWVWVRTRPAPELIVSVFDAHRETWPVDTTADVLDEHGKGLTIVDALSSATGAHFTRSRFAVTVLGKRVWFALALPTGWPAAECAVPPALAARRLFEVLSARGIAASLRSDDSGVSVVTIDALNVWVQPKVFAWRDGNGYVRLPLVDLQETVERIVGHVEAVRAAASTAC